MSDDESIDPEPQANAPEPAGPSDRSPADGVPPNLPESNANPAIEEAQPGESASAEDDDVDDLSWERDRLRSRLIDTFDSIDPFHSARLKARCILYPVLSLALVLFAAVGAVFTFLLILALYWLLRLGGLLVGDWTVYLLYSIMLVIAVFAVGSKKMFFDDAQVESSNGKTIMLGRYETFDIASFGMLLTFFGAILAIQFALVYYMPGHTGLPIEGGFWQSFWICADNACHGLLLDTFEIYDLRLTEKLDYGFWAATVMFIFRLAYDGSVLFMIVLIVRKRRTVLPFRSAPREGATKEQVAAWIANSYHADEHSNQFFDESMFLRICKHYLRGEIDHARDLAQQFPQLQVTDTVREMLVDADGNCIFPPQPKTPEDNKKE